MRISAGQLRALGREVPAEIPDCATAEVELEGPHDCAMTDDGRFTCTIEMRFLSPLSWIELSVEVAETVH